MKRQTSQQWKEKGAQGIFFLCSAFSILGIISICYFIFAQGLPFIAREGVLDFLLGKTWSPVNQPPAYGIFPMIAGSTYVTIGAIIVGVPIGLFTAIYMVFYAGNTALKVLDPAISLMAGIPSIVYGFFTLNVIVPIVRKTFGGTGMSLFTAAVLLGIMILPTIIRLSSDALRGVSPTIINGSYALGADKERTVFSVVLPAAKSGIFASIILGIGRAMGETMAVILVAGNQPRVPKGLFEGVRTLTTNIVMEMGYASGDHRQALIATGAVLFIFILLINIAFAIVKRRGVSS